MSFPRLWSQPSESAVSQEGLLWVTVCTQRLKLRVLFVLSNWGRSIIHYKDFSNLTVCPKLLQVFYLEHKLIIKKLTQWDEVYMESELRKKRDTKKKKKKNFSCTETLNEKWSRSCGYLTSQTAWSLEALASVRSPTKSSVFDMASFTCLTTVKQREEGSRVRWGGGDAREAARRRRNGRFNKNLTFPIRSLATSLCSRVSYLATMIVFTAEVSAGHRCCCCCCCFLVRPAQCTQGWGGGDGVRGGCRTWKHQSVFRSPWANTSERPPWRIISEVTLPTTLSGLEIQSPDMPLRYIFQTLSLFMPEILYRDKFKETENRICEEIKTHNPSQMCMHAHAFSHRAAPVQCIEAVPLTFRTRQMWQTSCEGTTVIH